MVKITGIENIGKRIKRKIHEFKSSETEMNKVAKVVQNDLRASLRKGIQSDDSVNYEPMPELSAKTIERRLDMEEYNRTNKNYFPSLSNITFSGDLVNKIYAEHKAGEIIIYGKGEHKKMLGTTGKTLKQSTIKEILRGLYDKGWRLLYVAEPSKRKIAKQFKEFLRRKE